MQYIGAQGQNVALSSTPVKIEACPADESVLANLSALTASGSSCTVAYYGPGGLIGQQVLGAGAPLLIVGVELTYITLTGSGTITVDVSGPEVIDPRYLSVQGPANVTIAGDTVGLAKDGSVQTTNTEVANIWSNFTSGRVPMYTTGSGKQVVAIHDLGA